MCKCYICSSKDATKKNSHLIPSFISASVFSYDHSSDRNKGIIYSLGKGLASVHFERDVPPEYLARNFADIEEAINNNVNNEIALDNIFCPSCEKRLAEILESPYSNALRNGKNIRPDISFFFWLSVLWRCSMPFPSNEGALLPSVDIPLHFLESIRRRLDSYMAAMSNNADIVSVCNKMPVSYKILHCKDYGKNNPSVIYGEFDKKNKTASIILGDFILCFMFKRTALPASYKFYGLSDIIRKAPTNSVYGNELIVNITDTQFNDTLELLKDSKIIPSQLQSLREYIRKGWCVIINAFEIKGLPLKPTIDFENYVIKEIYNDDTLVGDKNSKHNVLSSILKGFKTYYNLPFYDNYHKVHNSASFK